MADTFGQQFNTLLKNGAGNSGRRWKKQDFAERLGRHPDTISNWINGKTTPNNFDLTALIQLLELSAQDGKEFKVLRDEAAHLIETKRSQRRTELAAVGQPSVGSLSEDDEDMPINRRTFLGAGLAVLGAPASSGVSPQVVYRPEQIYTGLVHTAQHFGLRSAQDNYFDALNWNRATLGLLAESNSLSKQQTIELHLLAAVSGALVANAAFSLGNIPEALERARNALLNAEFAGVQWLQVWLLSLQSSITLRENRFETSTNFALKAQNLIPEHGTALVKLLSTASLAYARLGDKESAITMMQAANEERAKVRLPHDFGDWFWFRHEHQLGYESACYRVIGGTEGFQKAHDIAINAFNIHCQRPVDQWPPSDISLVCLSSAEALLGLGEIEGAQASVRTAIDNGKLRPTKTIRLRLKEIQSRLVASKYRDIAGVHLFHEDISHIL